MSRASATFALRNITYALRLFNDERLPPADLILLDEIDGLRSQDWRRSILYAAMAVEVMADTTIDALYEYELK